MARSQSAAGRPRTAAAWPRPAPAAHRPTAPARAEQWHLPAAGRGRPTGAKWGPAGPRRAPFPRQPWWPSRASRTSSPPSETARFLGHRRRRRLADPDRAIVMLAMLFSSGLANRAAPPSRGARSPSRARPARGRAQPAPGGGEGQPRRSHRGLDDVSRNRWSCSRSGPDHRADKNLGRPVVWRPPQCC